MRKQLTLSLVGLLLCTPLFASADANTDQRAALQAQLDRIEQEISQNQGSLTALEAQKTTLERDIAILDNKIQNAKLQVKQTDLSLKQLSTDITDKQQSIQQVDAKVAAGEASLAQILRRTREIDDTSLPALILSTGSLSDVFQQVDAFDQVNQALQNSFTELGVVRDDLANRKAALEDRKDEQQKVRDAQLLAQLAIQRDEQQKQQILTVTKGQEKTYQQIIADKQKQAQAIREALFGLRDSGAIQFGTAYSYAKEAGTATGVRPALILAILTQETDLGKNIGSCYVTSLDTGDGVGKNSGRFISKVMKAPRDTAPYKTLTDALGLDWTHTPVSCPQSVGYGGAMGPGQFIPSTWVLYEPRLTRLTGQSTPDPWSARTAIYATAMLMADNGADGGSRSAERTAALKYFAGGNWARPGNAFYGDNVMDLADNIQSQIDVLNQVVASR